MEFFPWCKPDTKLVLNGIKEAQVCVLVVRPCLYCFDLRFDKFPSAVLPWLCCVAGVSVVQQVRGCFAVQQGGGGAVTANIHQRGEGAGEAFSHMAQARRSLEKNAHVD